MHGKSHIIETYLSADEEQRLSMFLDHRELRHHFVRIDLEAVKLSRRSNERQQKTPFHRQAAKGLHDLCRGWLRRCWSVH